MFDSKPTSHLHQTQRYGQVDVPAVSEETLEKFNDLYNRSVEGAATVNTLVLGATPELRDIVLSYNHHLTTVDHDAKMVQAKSRLMHYHNHANETIVISDWLTMRFPDNTFDVILGDGVLTALQQEDQKTLLDILHRILKPTGYLLLREGAVVHRRPRFDPTVHVHQYRSGQYTLFDLFFGLRLYNQNYKSIDAKTRKTYLNDFKQKIDHYYQQGVLSVNERKQLYAIASELEHTLLHKEDLEDLLKTAFFPKDVIHDIGSGHLSPWYFFLTQPSGLVALPGFVPASKHSSLTTV